MPPACVCHTVRPCPRRTQRQKLSRLRSRSPTSTSSRSSAGNGAASSDNLLIEVDGKLVPNYDATIHPFSEGDVVSGKVVRIDQDEVLVDIGYKSEGVIPSNELSIRKSVDPSEEVELGEEVDALVLTKEDQEGRLILSKKRARFEKAWRRIEQAADTGEPVDGTVIEVVKGGLILDLGVRGFLPASLVDIRRVQNLDEFMGQKLECKVIELNRSRNNVVLSRRAVLEEERKEVREQILGRLEPGQVVEGKISNIVDFGAFVDLEGIDGLIHISELSWSHVNHPSEVVSIGDTVRVKVLDIDQDRQRISLGLKQTQEDPWQRVLNEYKEGDVVDGKVTKIVAFGAFVQILPGVEGLVHISELAQHHVESPAEVVRPGDELKVKILEVDESRRRLSLSVKRVEGQELPIREPSDDVVIEDAEPPEGMEPPAEPAPPRRPPRPRPRKARRQPPRPLPRRRPRPLLTRCPGPPRRGARARRRGAPEPHVSRRGTDRRAHCRGGASVRGATAHPGLTRFVGLTGGIGAGKSEALAAFERLGAPTLSTDSVAHDLLDDERGRGRAGGPLGRGNRTGRQWSIATGSARSSSTTATSSPGWRASPIPRVGAHVLEWRQDLGPDVAVAVVEVPLLFEAAMEDAFDATVAVVADDELRDARLRERGQGGLAGREERQLDQAREGAPCRPRHPQRCLASRSWRQRCAS